MKTLVWSFASALLATAASIVVPAPATAQEIGKLYAARPPEGSAFVRVVSGLEQPAAVGIGADKAETLSAADGAATVFRIVKGDTQVPLSVDGAELPEKLSVPADAFVTVLLRKDGDKIKATPVVDSTQGQDALKVELRVYNLVPACAAAIVIASGPEVFNGVETDSTRRRAINPVAATLEGRCGEAASKPLTLPALKAGDRFSLFLTGTAARPVLHGQIDRTEGQAAGSQ